jgi:hypothetical protein
MVLAVASLELGEHRPLRATGWGLVILLKCFEEVEVGPKKGSDCILVNPKDGQAAAPLRTARGEA